MVTLAQLCGALRSVGLPYAQDEWDTEEADRKSPPPLPYAILVAQASEDVIADESNFVRVTPYDVEVYTRGRDMDLERRLEDALAALPTAWSRTHAVIGHNVSETVYTVRTLGR